MFAQLLTPDYLVFAVAFLVMIGIGLVEAVGLGLGHLDLDSDLDAPEGWPLLDWLGLKHGLPVLIWLTSLLACFTFAGLAVQQIAAAALGAPLFWPIAAALALVIALVANVFCASLLAGIFPDVESTVIRAESLLRRRGTVLEGTARRGAPARAKVIDHHGQAHYVMVEPHDDGDAIAQGQSVLLVRKDGPVFMVLSDVDTPFTSL